MEVSSGFEIQWCLVLHIGPGLTTFSVDEMGAYAGGCLYVCLEGVGFLWFGGVDSFCGFLTTCFKVAQGIWITKKLQTET